MKELDVVALLVDRPELGLAKGQVGTIVEQFEPGTFHVEFVNTDGWTYALTDLPRAELMQLMYDGEGIGAAAA